MRIHRKMSRVNPWANIFRSILKVSLYSGDSTYFGQRLHTEHYREHKNIQFKWLYFLLLSKITTKGNSEFWWFHSRGSKSITNSKEPKMVWTGELLNIGATTPPTMLGGFEVPKFTAEVAFKFTYFNFKLSTRFWWCHARD